MVEPDILMIRVFLITHATPIHYNNLRHLLRLSVVNIFKEDVQTNNAAFEGASSKYNHRKLLLF